MQTLLRPFPQCICLIPTGLLVAAGNIGEGRVYGAVASINALAFWGFYGHGLILYLGALLGIAAAYLVLGESTPSRIATFVLYSLFSVLTVALTLQGGFLEFPSGQSLDTTIGIAVLGIRYISVIIVWQSVGTAVAVLAPWYIWHGIRVLLKSVYKIYRNLNTKSPTDG